MALTINNFSGAETGGLEEISSAIGGVSSSALNPHSGSYAYRLEDADGIFFVPFSVVPDAGDDYVIGFSLNLSGVPPSTTIALLRLTDSGGSFFIEVRYNTAGSFQIINALGNSVGASPGGLSAGSGHFIELYFQHAAFGSAELFVDGDSIISVSLRDFTDGGTFNNIRFLNTTGSGVDLEIDDFYFLSGATAASDRLGPVEVYMKQGAQTGTTPDTSALADTTLDEGTWDLASETPLNEQSQAAAPSYTGGTAAGVVYADGSGDKLGPNGDDRFTGVTIKAMKGIWRMARSGGGGTTQVGEIGNDGGAASDIESSPDLDITTGYANYEFLTETAATLPALTEHAAIGFSKDGGGQHLDVAEMWAMTLVVPSAPNITDLAGAEWPDQNYHAGPFEI